LIHKLVTHEYEGEPAVTEIYSDNRITLLHNGDAYFLVLEEALDRTEHGIFLETYIFENDHTGRRIAEALKRAALPDRHFNTDTLL